MAPVQDPPATVDMVDNDSVQDGSTKSNGTEGRRLRQVLQKKQLDVLLQTYSSYLDEPEEPRHTGPEHYSISRKQSIEGNPPIIDLVDDTDDSFAEKREGYPRKTNHDIGQLRRNGSLISVDDDCTKAGGRNRAVPPASDDEANLSDGAVADKTKGPQDAPGFSPGRKSNKKKPILSKRKKRGDFTTRMLKANDVVTGFGMRCTQKHLEIAEDFQQVTTELRHHLKHGANIVFEDMADQFDGIVENLFVTEQRDDGGDRQGQRRQQDPQASSRRQPSSQREDPHFRPLTHDETIMAMNRQVTQLLEPMAALTDRIQDLSCLPHHGEGFEVHHDNGRVVTTASF